MNQPFADIGFFLEVTNDGSPTLRLGQKIVDGESMHHSGGAATETNYIYKSIIRKALARFTDSTDSGSTLQELKTAVIGLGLGYIEISWAQALIENKLKPSVRLSIDSFEIVPGLRDRYSSWVDGDDKVKLYEEIAHKLDPQIESKEVRKTLQHAYRNQSFLYDDVLKAPTERKFNVICHDAFSQKTNSSLWQPEFLNHFLVSHAEQDCVLTTYACTGVLKKVLADNGFHFIKRPGFHCKRDSTIALRGIFMSDLEVFQTF